MNPIMCYFLLQLGGLYGLLVILDYGRRPGSKYLEAQKPAINLTALKKKSTTVEVDKAA